MGGGKQHARQITHVPQVDEEDVVAAAAALAAAQQRNRRRRRRPPPRAVLFEHVRFNRLLVAITYRGRLLAVTDAKARCHPLTSACVRGPWSAPAANAIAIERCTMLQNSPALCAPHGREQ